MRPYRVIQGVAYPPLVRGRNSTTQLSTNRLDRDAFYYDEAIKLSEADIEANANLVGTPLCIEHAESTVVGEVTRSWTDQDGKLRFLARVYTDTVVGRDAVAKIESGEQKAVSVGYMPIYDPADPAKRVVAYKKFRELSLCKRGFFPGAEVGILASKSTTAQYKSPEDFLYVNYQIMATDKIDTAELGTVPTPPTPTPSDAGEVTRQADQLIRENAALEQEVAQFKALYAAAKQKELERTLEGAKYAYQAAHGADAVLPPVYVEGTALAFAAPQLAKSTEVAFQMSNQLLAEKDRRIAIEASYAELKKQAAEREAELQEYRKRESQLSDRLGRRKPVEETVATVTASAVSSGLAVKPSQPEIELLMRDYGRDIHLTPLGPVRASGTVFKGATPAPNPYRADERGMRGSQRELFAMIQDAAKSNPSLPGMQYTVTEQKI